MTFSLSTRWNAYRHTSGEEMIEEILELGFNHVELGYDLTIDLVPGVRKMVDQNAVTVESVHNFCPVPVGAPYGHPEIFLLTSLDERERERAVMHTTKTVDLAAQVGATRVVVHTGRVNMKNVTRDLISLSEQGRQYESRYEKRKLNLLMKREKKARKHLESLYRSLDALLPVFESCGARLAMENLPSWESIPSEIEMENIFRQFDTPTLGYWHDMGHAQVRQNLGFISHRLWLEKLADKLVGVHIHDVVPPAKDHLMPPHGNIDFESFAGLIGEQAARVFEPVPDAPAADVREAVRVVGEAWRVP